MMRMLLTIVGIVLALPILLTLVALAVVTLIGGYIAVVAHIAWWLLAIVAVIAVGIFIVKVLL